MLFDGARWLFEGKETDAAILGGLYGARRRRFSWDFG
jgi:hypothetical protein